MRRWPAGFTSGITTAVVDIVLSDHVELGGFLMVIAIVVAMMITRELVNRAHQVLGKRRRRFDVGRRALAVRNRFLVRWSGCAPVSWRACFPRFEVHSELVPGPLQD
jgi:hypothetical protein